MSETGVAVATWKMMTIDCADPRTAATFYAALLGCEVVAAEDEYGLLAPVGDGPAIGFGRVEGFSPPSWPNDHGSKQFHLDLAVDDLEAAASQAQKFGATLPEFQPGEGRWKVLLDPAGHPFCLTLAANWA